MLVTKRSLCLRVDPKRQLFQLGARNVALFGICKIGCTPRIVASLGGGVGCAEEVNQAADIFNNKLKTLVVDLNNQLSRGKFTYVDLFSGNAEDFASCCCTVEPGQELCAVNGTVCPDRTNLEEDELSYESLIRVRMIYLFYDDGLDRSISLNRSSILIASAMAFKNSSLWRSSLGTPTWYGIEESPRLICEALV
ncbi:unnamed protein product [Brassica oleracea var. botrytis]|uniref:(rape) hypothetical protein n=1 Tax=Brassica napus TaxID=3708 RepID=A0A816R866_BRANA|nr:hypothetical protein HID58_040742 [Brassica napus]CAF2068905.1 unnamed protein product [Brassica napus]